MAWILIFRSLIRRTVNNHSCLEEQTHSMFMEGSLWTSSSWFFWYWKLLKFSCVCFCCTYIMSNFSCTVEVEMWDSMVSIMPSLQSRWSGVYVQAGAKIFLSPKDPEPTQPPIQGEPGTFPRVNWLGLEADDSFPASTNVQNEWSCTPLPFALMAFRNVCYYFFG